MFVLPEAYSKRSSCLSDVLLDTGGASELINAASIVFIAAGTSGVES